MAWPDATGVPHTCPLIDDAQRLMEKVRAANGELRDKAVAALGEVDELTERVRELERENRKLEDELTDLRSELERVA